MEDDAQGQGYLRSDMIFFAGVGSTIFRRPRRGRRHDTPAWVSDRNFALWTATQGAPQAAAADRPRSSKRARVDAISEEAILGLRQLPGRSRSGEECAVCLHGFRADETLRAMPCSHAFHHHCISQWLRRNAVCPLCRHRLPTAPTQAVEEEEEQDVAQEVEEEEEVEWVDGGGGGEGS